MMGLLLMLCVFCCPLVLSESGDDDTLDGDTDWNVICSSSLSFSGSNLTCSLNDESIEGVLTLCSQTDDVQTEKCTNASQGPHGFTFPNLPILPKYKLQIKPGNYIIKENIKLSKIVKLPAPQIKFAIYMKDSKEISTSIQQNHDFVKEFEFQVKVLQDKLVVKNFSTPNKNFTISSEIIGGDGVYNICVQVKPSGYFDGMWSEWSPKASVIIESTVKPRLDSLIVIYIIIFISLVFIIIFVALQWKTHIKGYIKPNIPHPKTTLAQIHRGKEGFPYIFSPEIFSDVFIHRVVYDEKPSAPDLQESLDERRYSQASSASSQSTLVCELDTTGAELSTEQSHLKIRLLNESDFSNERTEGGSEGVLQRECKDEAYVTMSSLFKTQ